MVTVHSNLTFESIRILFFDLWKAPSIFLRSIQGLVQIVFVYLFFLVCSSSSKRRATDANTMFLFMVAILKNKFKNSPTFPNLLCNYPRSFTTPLELLTTPLLPPFPTYHLTTLAPFPPCQLSTTPPLPLLPPFPPRQLLTTSPLPPAPTFAIFTPLPTTTFPNSLCDCPPTSPILLSNCPPTFHTFPAHYTPTSSAHQCPTFPTLPLPVSPSLLTTLPPFLAQHLPSN